MAPPLPPQPAPRQSRGCFFYGCLTLVVVGLLALAGLGFGGYFAYQKFVQVVDQYTATSPGELPKVEMADADYTQLDQRVTDFGQALAQNRTSPPLTLTADEINVLLARSEGMEAWRDRIHVMMEGDQVRGQVSLPLDPIAQGMFLSRLQGRYLNGAARLEVGMQGGRLQVRLLGAEVNGQAIPAEVMQAFQSFNLADPAYENPQQEQFLRKIGRVEVRDGRLIITPAASP